MQTGRGLVGFAETKQALFVTICNGNLLSARNAPFERDFRGHKRRENNREGEQGRGETISSLSLSLSLSLLWIIKEYEQLGLMKQSVLFSFYLGEPIKLNGRALD